MRAAELEIGKDASFVFKGENGFELESGDYMIQGNKKDRNKINIILYLELIQSFHKSDLIAGVIKPSFQRKRLLIFISLYFHSDDSIFESENMNVYAQPLLVINQERSIKNM